MLEAVAISPENNAGGPVTDRSNVAVLTRHPGACISRFCHPISVQQPKEFRDSQTGWWWFVRDSGSDAALCLVTASADMALAGFLIPLSEQQPGYSGLVGLGGTPHERRRSWTYSSCS